MRGHGAPGQAKLKAAVAFAFVKEVIEHGFPQGCGPAFLVLHGEVQRHQVAVNEPGLFGVRLASSAIPQAPVIGQGFREVPTVKRVLDMKLGPSQFCAGV